MARKSLNEKELNKLSGIVNVPEVYIKQILDRNLLDLPAIRSLLIKKDYKRVCNENPQYSKAQIVQAIAIEYEVSVGFVHTLVYNKVTHPIKKCKVCGAEMTNYKFTKNRGICDNCAIPNIEV